MAIFKFSIALRVCWDAAIILQLNFAIMMPLPGVPDIYIRSRDIHLQARINSHTGNVTLAMLCDPHEAEPVPSDWNATHSRAERSV